MSGTTNPVFFEALYAGDPDPWQFACSEYEQDRFASITAALADRRYPRAFEPGCSIGILTAMLAAFCGQLIALDGAQTAVQKAREHCRYLPNVELRTGTLPRDLPEGSFDLIVLSEIGYYFEEEDLLQLACLLTGRLNQNGVLLAAHWLGHSDDHVLSGDRVHELLHSLDGLRHDRFELHPSQQHAGFRLDRWLKI